MTGPGEPRPLWACPRCGHRFVTANLWHSCGRYDLDDHFRGRDPVLRLTFDRFASLLEACGPVTIYAQKTRIIAMVRVRFAGAVVSRRWIDLRLWLPHRIEHRALHRIEPYPRGFGHTFRVHAPHELDGDFAELVPVAYRVGAQDWHA